MLLKSYAFQPFQNQAAYLRSNFNRLDVVVVAASLLTLIFNGVGALKALRLLRYVLGLSQIPAHRFISQLVTVQTDRGDCCLYIVQYIAQHKTLTTFRVPTAERCGRCEAFTACRPYGS
jgi:hypothetical protein